MNPENPYLLDRGSLATALDAATTQIAHLEMTITEQQETIRDLEERVAAADADHLTGAATRRALSVWWDNLGPRPGDTIGAVLIVDGDGMHDVNDRWGHPGGDKVIRRYADAAMNAAGVRYVARFGGDEFLVLTKRGDGPEDSKTIAYAAAEEILVAVSADLRIHGGEIINPSVSIGVHHQVDTVHLYRLMQRADAAMFQAKRRGGNGFHVSA